MTGKVVSRGKIRVDARKAVAKLREHLLVDLRDYVLELTRSAVAGGAKQLAIDYDANDFIIGWAGAAVDQEPLEHLLDYALADPGDGDTRRLRLLALGVNAALGLEPRFVDVYSAVEASCTRVRFLPAMLSDDGDTRPQAEQVDAPEGMPTTGMRVHVRERLSWHVVRRATKLAGPPELESLAKGCLHLPATIEVRGQPRVNSERYPPLLRVEFDVPGCDRAFVDLMPAEFSPAVVDLLEQGVRLAHHEWTSDDIPATAAQLPVRVVVDARVLPTNASRSRVREESSLYRHIKETSRAALMSALHAVLSGAELPSNMTLLGERGAAEHAAARCLDAIMIRWRQGKHISPAARNLLDLPLLRNGIGDALSYADLPSGNAVMVYRGHKALEAELSLWMRDVVWLRGVPCELPMQHVTQHDVSGHIERAREGVARRDAFMAHEPSGPVLGESADYLVKGAFRAPAGELAGLHGEVAVVDAPASSRGPRVRIFFEDRPLDVRDLDPVWVPLPLDIALAWPDHLLPSWGFDGVTQSAQLNTAIAYAVMSGVGLLAKRTGMIAQHPQIRGLLRAAVGTVLQAEMGLQVDVDFELENDARELIRARIWPTTDPAKFASVVDIQKQRARYAALFTAAPGTIGSAADGRTVLAVATTESGWLWRALAGEVNLVDYTRAVLSPGGRHESWEERKRTAVRKAYNALLDVQLHGRPVSLNIDRPGVHARIGIGSPGRVGRLHAGLPVETTIHPPRFGLVNLAIDDDELVPNMTWTEAQRASPEDDLEAELELELLNEVVAAVEGDEQARQRLNNWPDEMTLPLRRYLLDSVTKLRNELGELAVDDPRREPLKSLYDHALVAPLLSLLNQKGEPVPRSLLHVQRRFSGAESIPTLMEPPGFETLDWYPIIEPEAALWHHIASAVGWRLHNAVGELSGREYMAGQERRRKQILEQPSLAIERMGDRAAPGAPVAIHETGAAGDRMIVAVSLPAQNAPKETHVEVLYHRRLIFDTQLTSFGPPVVARVNFSTADEFVGWADLNAIGYQRAHQAIAEAASQLVIKLLATDEPLAQPNALALIVSVASLGVSDTLKAKLENTAWWPTIRGKDTTLAKLLRPGRQIYTGRSRYERWWSAKRGFTELDRPILYIQDGHAELFATLFDALAINAEDVTDAVASLQQQRSQGPGDAPKLAGEPAHTLLRESATELGVLVARGEVELTPVGPPRVVVTDIHGTAHRVTAVNELPINATLAMDGLATKPNMDRLASELRWAVERWTQKLATQVGELPEFVRAIIREMIWRRTRQAEPQLADELLKAPVWQDIRGNWHSIDRLTNSKFKRVWFTMKQPPYPAHDFKRPIIRLSSHLADEVDNLRKLLPLSSATTRLENMLEGETRRSAAPRDSFSLDAVSRAACLETVRLDGAMTGELGVLSPSTRGYQRIDVHATRRPVCTIDDDLAWPVVAVINDDTLDVGMYFNRIS